MATILCTTNIIAQTNTFPTTGNAGVGLTTPTAKLHVSNLQKHPLQTGGANYVGLTLDNLQTFNIASTQYNPPTISSTWVLKNIFEINNSRQYTNATYSKPIVVVNWNGDVAIGKATPSSMLDVNGTATSINTHVSNNATIIGNLRVGPMAANSSYSGYRLSVDGDMICKRAIVQIANWADFVFDENYALPKLEDVETYIKANKHLPNIPTTKQVTENGIDVSEMNKLLLQKVEELTLYMIELQKQNINLQVQINNLK